MEYIITILILIILVLSYIIFNLNRKNEILEQFIYNQSDILVKLNTLVKESSKKLEEIDSSGSFSSDDEVGFFFSYVKNIQKTLENYLDKNIKTF